MRHSAVAAVAFLSMAAPFPALAQSRAEDNARCLAALDARTVASRSAERAADYLAARAGERPSAEMQALRALTLATQTETIRMVELRCKGRIRR